MRFLMLLAFAPLCWAQTPEFTVETPQAAWTFGGDAVTHRWTAKDSGVDYAAPKQASFARILEKGTWHAASSATLDNGQLTLGFADSAVRAVLRVQVLDAYFMLEVVSVEGEPDELVFIDVPLTTQGVEGEPFAFSTMALNLETNVPSIPGPSKRVEAHAYRRFGMPGTKIAVVAQPIGQLRETMKTVVRAAAPAIPQSDIGGPWALDGELNRGSYLFDFGKLTETTVDAWIACAQSLGLTQIDFHTGTSLRFGDCEPNPKLFPNGRASVKAVIDKLHAAGISAGLHTYAFFMAKDSKYVTPVPDPRLGKDATFTLAADLTAEANEVGVGESTEKMSPVTGFFVMNSDTVQIDDELIVFKKVRKEAPYAFIECQRGAHGTKAAAHAKGAKVYHLRECFGLFAPDADSTLLAEVAANSADTFNECGFDMMYLDALDGEGVLAGPEWGWYYGSKFVFEIAKRLKKPALFEMSTFHHHLWYVRARMGAWDTSQREHKRYADIHVAANRAMWNTFLPMNLGWWTVKIWDKGPFGTQNDPTFPEDVEYLLGKCIGTDSSISLMGVDPEVMAATPAYQRLAPIFKDYETVRHAKVVPDAIKEQLRQPNAAFVMEKDEQGNPRFAPADHLPRRTAGVKESWNVQNRFDAQPLRVRIEALNQTEPGEGAAVVADFTKTPPTPSAATGVAMTGTLQADPDSKETSLHLEASNGNPSPDGAWGKLTYTFDEPLDWSKTQGLGVWVKGDGQGALLNVQLRSPEHTVHLGYGDHYITLDFTGWRYFELVEPDSGQTAQYRWPYSGSNYAIYREYVDYAQVKSLSFWLNNVPSGKQTACDIRPVRGLKLQNGKVLNPTLRVGDAAVSFPVELETGQYLEYDGGPQAVLYGPKGESVKTVDVQGAAPTLAPGANALEFACEGANNLRPRTRVTVHTRGARL